MPLISSSSYQGRPFYLFSSHLETIVPSLFFKVQGIHYRRERLELDDGDFLDLDWLEKANSRCLVISHGLEGSSERYYVKRTAKYFEERGWDICAWNCRSCSEEMNRLPRLYHHGETGDLDRVVGHVLKKGYDQVVLFGYSMGGSMSIKFLGESERDARIVGAITFSVPCNLKDSAEKISQKGNRFYERRFLRKVVEKMKIKADKFTEINVTDIDDLADFDTFHERYTVPLHGFSTLSEFYSKSTCDQFLANIKVPLLIANAINDPMLGDKCYPVKAAERSEYVYLETPRKGGHVGFTVHGYEYSWMEIRSEQFLREVIL